MAKQIMKGIESGNFGDGAAHQRTAMADIELLDDLEKSNVNTIMHGLEDQIIATEASRQLHEGIEDSQLELIPMLDTFS